MLWHEHSIRSPSSNTPICRSMPSSSQRVQLGVRASDTSHQNHGRKWSVFPIKSLLTTRGSDTQTSLYIHPFKPLFSWWDNKKKKGAVIHLKASKRFGETNELKPYSRCSVMLRKMLGNICRCSKTGRWELNRSRPALCTQCLVMTWFFSLSFFFAVDRSVFKQASGGGRGGGGGAEGRKQR